MNEIEIRLGILKEKYFDTFLSKEIFIKLLEK